MLTIAPLRLCSNRLDWPSGASSKKSVKAVAKLRRLRDYLRQHSDATLHEYIDLLMDLVRHVYSTNPLVKHHQGGEQCSITV